MDEEVTLMEEEGGRDLLHPVAEADSPEWTIDGGDASSVVSSFQTGKVNERNQDHYASSVTTVHSSSSAHPSIAGPCSHFHVKNSNSTSSSGLCSVPSTATTALGTSATPGNNHEVKVSSSISFQYLSS